MTMAVERPGPAGPAQCFRMTHITRRAEKQVEKLLRGLSWRGRKRVVSALLRPVPCSLCGIITSRDKRRLFHFRPRCRPAIHVCYRRLSGPDVVILDVALHDNFEEYAKDFTGSFGSHIPIKESRIMSQYATNGTSPRDPQVASPPGSSHSATPPSAPASAPSGPDAAEALARLLLESRAFGKQSRDIDDTIMRSMEAARDEAIRKIEGRLAGQGELFEKVSAELAGLQDRLTAATEGIEVHRAEPETAIEGLRESASSGDAGLAGAIANCERNITITRADVCYLEERLGDLNRKIESRLGAIDAALAEDRTAPLAARLDRLAADTEHLGRREAERDARLATTSDVLRECREETFALRSTLTASDARTCGLEDQVTALQRTLRELVEQVARERHRREQRSIKARLARLIDSVRSSLVGFRRRRYGAGTLFHELLHAWRRRGSPRATPPGRGNDHDKQLR